MKISNLFSVFGFGTLLFGGYTGGAQQVSSLTPIVVRLAEIDRAHVYVHPPRKPLSGATLSLLFKDLEQSKVDELAKKGVASHSPVWVMDGQKLLVQSSLVGEAIYQVDEKGKRGYGLLLGFDSTEAAEKAAAALKPESKSKEASSQRKK